MSASESHHLKVHVINMGSVWRAKVTGSTKISKLMNMAVSHYHGIGAHFTSKSTKCKLIHVRTRAVLSVEKTVAEEELRDNDEVLLVEKVTAPNQIPQDLRGPTAAEIYEATKHLDLKNVEKLKNVPVDVEDDLDYSERFSKDSSRIFISLIETAARLLAFASNGMDVYNLVKKEMKPKREPARSSPCVKQLIDMGFSESTVLRALTEKKMNVSEAMEWLLEQSSSVKEKNLEEPTTSQSPPATVVEAFQELIRVAQERKHMNFKLNMKLVQLLKSMGYEEKDVSDALRECDNNIKAAISWLKENESGTMKLKSSQSLDSNGPLYKALMASEIVQLNIKKPKFLLALLSILEDPQSLTLWLKDRDISSILNHLILLHNTQSNGGQQII